MQPGQWIGAYRLERKLGEGGMKQVWRAAPRHGPRAVALAVVSRFDPRGFRNEVELARRVTSPHVAAVLDGFVTDDGRGVVVSELCAGLDLARFRQAHEPTPGTALAIAHQLARGLVAIHAAHVLHRDVKPANAILTRDGVKVIDFGISLPAVDARTGVGGEVPAAGTLPYMAPEAVGGELDARSDTYALGVSLYELVLGRLPLPRAGGHELVRRLVDRTPLPLDGLAGHDPRLRALVARLCEAEQARRPYLADVVHELGALAAALGGEVPVPDVTVEDVAPAWGAPAHEGAGPTMVPAPTLRAAPVTGFAPPRRIAVALPDAGRVVIGWPHLPVLALVPDGGGTRVRGFDPDGGERWGAQVADSLRGGLVADLDGDGVGELYAWSATRVHVIDAAGRIRMCVDVPPCPGAMPWDDGAPAPVVLEGAGRRQLVVGAAALDPVTRALEPAPTGWQGEGDALLDARGVTGLSCHGGARQRFRGDVATPAAILAPRGQPGFVVAALERVFDGGPTVRLGLWGPGGRRIGGGEVGRYALQTAPIELYDLAQQPATRLFAPHAAPLAAVGGGPPHDDVVVVPFLHDAAWFGPVLVGFDGTGAERWRERLARALTGPVPAPPILVEVDGERRPQLLWADADGRMHRRDARTGAARPPPAADGVPVAALDLGGRGVLHLVTWSPDAVALVPCQPCLPGLVAWIPPRGDLWRSGTLGADGLPVGPRG